MWLVIGINDECFLSEERLVRQLQKINKFIEAKGNRNGGAQVKKTTKITTQYCGH